MADNKSNTHAPFEIIRQEEGVESWAPPSMTVPGRVVQSAIKEKKRAKNESIEDIPPSKRPPPLTADALQKMAAEAKEEGFAEGRAEGLQSGHTEGYNKGFDAGSKKAYQETLTSIENERARLASIAEELLLPMQKQQQDLEQIVVDIAVNMAKKILQAEISTDPSLLFALVNRAINELPVGAKNIHVSLNQQDAELMAGLAEETAGIKEWPVHIDNSLTSGGCRVTSDESLIDFDVSTRIAKYFDEARESVEAEDDEDYPPMIERPEPIGDGNRGLASDTELEREKAEGDESELDFVEADGQAEDSKTEDSERESNKTDREAEAGEARQASKAGSSPLKSEEEPSDDQA
ncbi:FliH/SctL family protein [Saccharophagus degradans]|uniref:Flagellar assembly protein FliH n=1 Tax=Saccharophagus degradans (strain 2-40 / ATCC 43961 / DSM 17024) TaxID=203122 RepID=Q21IN3_SACD2|nr:FliH/SctL family protein [Saccharophagus degradans]ABD81446.1 flagellar assembly protein FliH [Saccharophagus degradans 2-40]